jgi:hypothetical protein
MFGNGTVCSNSAITSGSVDFSLTVDKAVVVGQPPRRVVGFLPASRVLWICS